MSAELLNMCCLVPNSARRVGCSLAYVSFLPLPDLFALPPAASGSLLCIGRKDTTQKDSEFFFYFIFQLLPPKGVSG